LARPRQAVEPGAASAVPAFTPQETHLAKGAAFAVFAAVGFSLTGVCIKSASATVSNEMIVFVRSLVSFLVLAPWMFRDGVNAVRTTRLAGHLWRSAFGVAAMYCFFYAIARLPLAAAMLLTYSTPLYVPFIAWIWIAERPPFVVFPAAIVGLVGIGFIVRPGGSFDVTAGLVGALAGVLAACAMVSIRRISDTEPASRIVFYFAALSTTIAAIPLLWSWKVPDVRETALLVATGVFATWGQLCLTRAYSLAPAARIGPFTYTSVIFSALLAWALWGESLDRWAALGIALVIVTCVMVGWTRREPQLEE
jgi:drug/metabolite transporter (DMT)-like permease